MFFSKDISRFSFSKLTKKFLCKKMRDEKEKKMKKERKNKEKERKRKKEKEKRGREKKYMLALKSRYNTEI